MGAGARADARASQMDADENCRGTGGRGGRVRPSLESPNLEAKTNAEYAEYAEVALKPTMTLKAWGATTSTALRATLSRS